MQPGNRVRVVSDDQTHRFIFGREGYVIEAYSLIVVVAVEGRRYPLMRTEVEPIENKETTT